jgi:hypothetical protein
LDNQEFFKSNFRKAEVHGALPHTRVSVAEATASVLLRIKPIRRLACLTNRFLLCPKRERKKIQRTKKREKNKTEIRIHCITICAPSIPNLFFVSAIEIVYCLGSIVRQPLALGATSCCADARRTSCHARAIAARERSKTLAASQTNSVASQTSGAVCCAPSV